MPAIQYQNTAQRSIACDGGRQLVLYPGVVRGELTLKRFEPSDYTGSLSLTEVLFCFRDRAGDTLLYRTVVAPLAFWPSGRVSIVPQAESGSHYSFMATLDDRSEFAIAVADGADLAGRRKYLALTCRVKITESELNVWSQINSDDARANRGFLTLQYRLPVEHLLWRRAPILHSNDIQCESQDWVNVQPAEPSKRDVTESDVQFA